MSPKSLLNRILPHLLALLLFGLLTVIYFSPVLDGKVLNTHDGTVFKATSKEIVDHREAYGEEPLWTNSLFGGMPSYLISTHFPGNLIKPLSNLLRLPGIPVAPIFLLMAGFYLMLLMLGTDRRVSVAGAIAYGFSSYFFIILTAGHNTKAMALAFMAPLVGSIIFAYRKNRVLGAALMALFLSLEIISNHLQITYYALLIVVIFGIFELVNAIRQNAFIPFLKTTGLLAAAAALAVAVNFASLVTTLEYSPYSMRGESEVKTEDKEDTGGLNLTYATQWSYGIDETLTFLIPNLKGGASVPFENDSETVKALRQNNAAQYIPQFRQYWGGQTLGTSGPVYIGVVVMLLFIMGLVLIKGRDRWWMIVAVLVSVMLAWGKNFMPLTSFFFDFFPGYNRFRAVTMILIIAEFCIPLLGILTLDRLMKGEIKKTELIRALKIAGGTTGGILLVFLLIPGLAGSFISEIEAGQLPPWLESALIADRREMLRNDLLRGMFFVITSAAVIYYTAEGKLKTLYGVSLIALLVVADMWPVNKRYLNNDNFVSERESRAIFDPSAADQAIIRDTTEYRVLNLTVPDPFSDGTTSYYHHSVGGYHGAKIRRYQDLISTHIGGEINTLASVLQNATVMSDLDGAFRGLNALNMLNTKYVIINPDATPLVNPEALGNAWFVDSCSFVSSPEEELLLVGIIDPATVAVVNESFADELGEIASATDESGRIELSDYRANRLTYTFNSNIRRLAVFSEIYYPAGWKAYINDEPVEIIRVNYLLRAVVVPEGNGTIVFKFDPDSYRMGNRVSMAGSLLLILFLALGLYVTFNRTQRKDEE